MSKRTQRKLSDTTKAKIANSRRGKKMADVTKNKISESMKKYWESIPYENNESNMDDNGTKIK